MSYGPSFVPGESDMWVNQLSLTHPVGDMFRVTAYPPTTSPDSVFGAEVRSREKVTEGWPTDRE